MPSCRNAPSRKYGGLYQVDNSARLAGGSDALNDGIGVVREVPFRLAGNFTVARQRVDIYPLVVNIASRFATSFFWSIATFGAN
jgi:hypothetical protein